MPQPGDFDQQHEVTISATGPGGAERLFRQGQIIGGLYKLKSILGRGGMGYVFCVEHLTLHSDYALKMLAPEQLNEEAKRRFAIEGKAIANLDHPNIVKVYDIGLEGGDCPFYVMDLLGGRALSESIHERRHLSYRNCLDIAIQIAEGLGHAHSKGIVHRDVKPSNIVLLPAGGERWRVKIVDFGIAKLLPSAQMHNQSLTATGTVFGSPLYMSPEQCMGAAVDHRTDIYSLGCTIFEMLSGRPPFKGANAMETVMLHQNAPVPGLFETAAGEELPEAVDILLAKMLEKRPQKRYQSMSQLIHDLERLRSGKGIVSPVGSTSATYNADNKYKLPQKEIPAAVQSGKFSLNKHWPILTLLISIGLAAVSIAVAINYSGQHSHPQIKSGDADIKQIDLDEFTMPRSMSLEDAWAAYNRIGKIQSQKVIVAGRPVRKFLFPIISMGRILTPNSGAYDCKGETEVPDGVPLTLEIGDGPSIAVLYEPAIVGRIDVNEFVGLSIVGRGTTDVASEFSGMKKTSDDLYDLLKMAQKWPNLTMIHLDSVAFTPKIFTVINSVPKLEGFSVRSAMTKLDDLARQPFLQKLSNFRMSGLNQVDILCRAMAGSKKLNALHIDECDLSPTGLRNFSSCPNLYSLELLEMDIDKLLPVVQELPGLHVLKIIDQKLSAEQITAVTSISHISQLGLSKSQYSEKEREALRNPKVVFYEK